MKYLRSFGVALGTFFAIVVLCVLGIIGWFLYKAMGFIITGTVIAALIYFICFYKPAPPTEE